MAYTTLLLAVPVLLGAVWVADTCRRLWRNYSAARTIGVPIRIIPFSPLNPFWVLLDRKVLSFIRHLPYGDNSFTRYNWRGWEVEDRYRSHHEMGDIWVLVTPLKNWIYINDPEALMSVFRRGVDFPRPCFVNEILNVFGPNIATAEGQSWKTQRRVATHCFNEQNNEIVWGESITLAGDMLRYWSSKSSVKTTADDVRTLSLHILSRAAFGKSFKFVGHDERDQSASVSNNYKESLQTILENCVLILGFGTEFIAKPWLPHKFRVVHKAWVSFRAYMTNMYEEEKRAFDEGRMTDQNLMTLLIRASQDEAKTDGGLTESEIYGNMFAFNFAGHDTTANTLTFALYFLAANPDVQDWISEEVRSVLGDSDVSEWDYRSNFPRLKRCLSVLLETIRLYTPVPVIKWTNDRSQTLTVGKRMLVLPPDSMIAPSYGAVQTDPRYWGPDSLEWSPLRWVKAGRPGYEDSNMPERGAFIGWSEGTRDCPGRKFSQVEFVATIAVLFKDWRVSPVTFQDESLEDARRRVMNLIKTDSFAVLLLQMLHPERAPLVWQRR
ncbi:cytochrome P450 [Annulohypoxylon truncatum]|uniref:cytochrome P450 n=1 Tax=Annulohypoxylon truncatum TaxID=327061 RepID=UPI0020085C11|nr:cytochrome P450 [Annulohypoxylon truncatum]KAI1205124.1 cytochrome P450 [Annulohypoxylon truncatum]